MPWTVTGGVMTTGDAQAEIFHGQEHATPYIVTVKVKGTAAGDQLRVLVGANAARSTYLIAQLTIGTGLLQLLNATGTVLATVTVPQVTVGDWHTLRVCLGFTDGGRILANVTTAANTKRYVYTSGVSVPSTYNQPSVGVGTGQLTGQASFDNFLWQQEQSEDDPDCPTCSVNCVFGSLICEDTSDWQAVAGNWTCGDTSDGNAILKLLTTQPENIHHHRVHGLVSATHDGSQALFYVRYKDPTTYLAGRITFGACGKIEILQDGVVLDSLNVGPLTSDENPFEGTARLFPQHFFCVVYDGTYLSAHLGPGGGQAQSLSDQYSWMYRHLRAEVTPDDDGLYTAIGTGANHGTVTMEDVFVSTPFSATHPFCDTCYNCTLTAGGIPDIPHPCEFEYTGSVRPLHDDYLDPIGVILSTAGSHAAYKGNIGVSDAYVDVTFRGTASGQTLRVYVNNDGDTTGPYAEIEIHDTLSHFRLSSGADQITLTPIVPNQQHRLLICLDSTSLTAVLNPGEPIGSAPGEASLYGTVAEATGKYVVFEQRGVNGDLEVIAPNYSRGSIPKAAGVSIWPTSCSRCVLECDCCENGSLPTELILEIPDIEYSGYLGGGITILGCIQDLGLPTPSSRICQEIPGAYVIPFSSPCVYEYASGKRIWQTNDAPPGEGDDSWYCWQLFIRVVICCSATTDGVAQTCDSIEDCVTIPAGHFRLGVTIDMRTQGHSPPPGQPPCEINPFAPHGTNPALVARHVSRYYSQPLPAGTNCFNFQDVQLTPLSWNVLTSPVCPVGPHDCNSCGALIFNGTDRIGWTSAFPAYISSA